MIEKDKEYCGTFRISRKLYMWYRTKIWFDVWLTPGVMPKRGLDVSACEIFRFYRLIAIKDLVEPLSMIVPRKEVGMMYLPCFLSCLQVIKAEKKSEYKKYWSTFFLVPSSQEFFKRTCTPWQLETRQPWPLRSGCWGSTKVCNLTGPSGTLKIFTLCKSFSSPLVSYISTQGPVLMSLKPETRVANPYPETPGEKGMVRQLSSLRFQRSPAAVTEIGQEFVEEVKCDLVILSYIAM